MFATGGVIDREGIACDDVEPPRIERGDFAKRGNAALVPLDRDHLARPFGDERAGETARARSNLDDRRFVERPGGARDAAGQIEIEQKILAERFFCEQIHACARLRATAAGRPTLACAFIEWCRRQPSVPRALAPQ